MAGRDADAELLAHVWRGSGANPEISAELAEKGIVVCTTLVTQDGFVDTAGGSTLLSDPRLAPWITEKAAKKLTTTQ